LNDLTSLAHLEDDGHTLDQLAAHVMIWCEVLCEGRTNFFNDELLDFDGIVLDVAREMEDVIRQLADRKKRLRDAEQKQSARVKFFSGH